MTQRALGRGVPAIVVAMVAVLLAGCAPRPPVQTADDPGCRREAYDDPQVKALMNRAAPSKNYRVFDFSFTTPREEADFAYRQAVLACMQRHGLMTSGGVEPVRQYPYGPLGF